MQDYGAREFRMVKVDSEVAEADTDAKSTG